MIIVQINSTAGSGSTGKIALDISDYLDNNDVRNYILYNSGQCNNKNAIKYQFKISRKAIALVSRLTGRYGFIGCFNTLNLIKKLEKINPDVIHLHNLHSHNCNLSMLFDYIKKNNIKVIWTFHDCWTFTGGCTHFDYYKCEQWKTCCKECVQKKKYSWFFDKSKRNYLDKMQAFSRVKDLTIVCPSQWLANLVKQSFLKEYSIKVINNGINLENFQPIDNNTFDSLIDRNKKILLGVASSFGERKGYNDFITLAQIIDKEKYQIVMVGVNKQQIAELEKFNIIGIERTENQVQLAELYSLANCFINCTYEDNFPTVNIEALACGCPVITYNTGGSPEVIDKQNGLIAEQGDVYNLYEKIQMLDIDEKMKNEISINAKNKYASELMAKKYLELYKD